MLLRRAVFLAFLWCGATAAHAASEGVNGRIVFDRNSDQVGPVLPRRQSGIPASIGVRFRGEDAETFA